MWKEGRVMSNNTERGKFAALVSAGLLLVFYIAIIMYVLINIVKISSYENFLCGITFQIIGFILLAFIIIYGLLGKTIKTGFMIPIIIGTIVYTILLDILNITGIILLPNALFFLVHMILLFVYLLIVMPLLVMGKQ